MKYVFVCLGKPSLGTRIKPRLTWPVYCNANGTYLVGCIGLGWLHLYFVWLPALLPDCTMLAHHHLGSACLVTWFRIPLASPPPVVMTLPPALNSI